MSKQQNKTTGRYGEDLAVKFLEDKGYRVVERNFGNKWGEIDIICQAHDTLVFVEVKTKKGELFGSPEQMVGLYKLQQIQKTASLYRPSHDVPVRIDVVAIVLSRDDIPIRITHYEAVY